MIIFILFFSSLFVNNLWTNPNTVTVYLICRHFHKLIPVFKIFATSLLWICAIWSSWWGTSHRLDSRNIELIQQSFCLEAEQFSRHSYKTKPGWRVINIWGKNKVQAVWNSAQNTPHLTSLSYFFPPWIVPLAIIFKQKCWGHYLPDPVLLKHRTLHLAQSQQRPVECSVPHLPVCLQLLAKNIKKNPNIHLWRWQWAAVDISWRKENEYFRRLASHSWYLWNSVRYVKFLYRLQKLLINGICNSVQDKFCWLPAARRLGFGIFFPSSSGPAQEKLVWSWLSWSSLASTIQWQQNCNYMKRGWCSQQAVLWLCISFWSQGNPWQW